MRHIIINPSNNLRVQRKIYEMDLYLHTPAHRSLFVRTCASLGEPMIAPEWYQTHFIRHRRSIFRNLEFIFSSLTENFSFSTNCTIFGLSTLHPLRPRHKSRSSSFPLNVKPVEDSLIPLFPCRHRSHG